MARTKGKAETPKRSKKHFTASASSRTACTHQAQAPRHAAVPLAVVQRLKRERMREVPEKEIFFDRLREEAESAEWFGMVFSYVWACKPCLCPDSGMGVWKQVRNCVGGHWSEMATANDLSTPSGRYKNIRSHTSSLQKTGKQMDGQT